MKTHPDPTTDWLDCLERCGVAPGLETGRGKTARRQVLARTYTLDAAARRLDLPIKALLGAVQAAAIVSFTDPEGRLRLPRQAVEAAGREVQTWERLAGFTPVPVGQLVLVTQLSEAELRTRLDQAGIGRGPTLWLQVRGKWGLPDSLRMFRAILKERDATRQRAARSEQSPTRRRSGKKAPLRGPAPLQVRDDLRQKLLEAFPSWDSDLRSIQRATVHIGPTNSGKTFEALNQLVAAGSGWYLSPLRLLAYEVFDTLNKRGVPCNLLTGEEAIPVEGAAITAATIEMFDPGRSGACVIVDEAHMLTDTQRGWAWTQAIMEARAPELHIIGAPFVEDLVMRLVEAVGVRVERVEHERLTPLQVIAEPWSLADLPPRTILVAFSRAMVLGLKTELERNRRKNVSVVYGSLPPEVRLNQAERFAHGLSEICVATDAVGMGLNLPADNVCFFEIDKFDGHSHRTLTANEIRQIGGRAGRFGLSEFGQVGALTRGDLAVVRRAIEDPILEYSFAYVAPTPEALGLIPGTLEGKLQKWAQLQRIPDKWKMLLRPVDLSQQIELASLLSPQEVERLGEARAFKLINAPTYRETEGYWLLCARAIIHRRSLPVPQDPPSGGIRTAEDLVLFEQAIRSADCYLWLSQRQEFHGCAPLTESVRTRRSRWSAEVDAALQRRVDTARRCRICGRPLPLKHRYGICQHCYRDRPAWRDEQW